MHIMYMHVMYILHIYSIGGGWEVLWRKLKQDRGEVPNLQQVVREVPSDKMIFAGKPQGSEGVSPTPRFVCKVPRGGFSFWFPAEK